MTSLKAHGLVRSTRPWLLVAACFALGLAACTGGTGKDGGSGPNGPPGPPGEPPTGTNPVGSAKIIVASITNVTVPDDGRPVVEVRLTNDKGTPLSGLPAGNIRFVLARLEPGLIGKSSTWHAITRKTEAFPGTPAPTPLASMVLRRFSMEVSLSSTSLLSWAQAPSSRAAPTAATVRLFIMARLLVRK